jgi:predicted Zn-dependent peptidase
VLILTGDVDAETALALARKHFGSWPVPAEPAPRPPRAEPAASGAGSRSPARRARSPRR